jgi:hypothetical protein
MTSREGPFTVQDAVSFLLSGPFVVMAHHTPPAEHPLSIPLSRPMHTLLSPLLRCLFLRRQNSNTVWGKPLQYLGVALARVIWSH